MREKRESKYVRFARLAYAIAQKSLPRFAHPKSPQRFTLPQLAVCVLLTHYLDLSYRDTEEWLLASAEVRAVLELDEVPDHTTIMRMAKRLTLTRIEAMQAQLLNQVEGRRTWSQWRRPGFASPMPAPTTPPVLDENTGTG